MTLKTSGWYRIEALHPDSIFHPIAYLLRGLVVQIVDADDRPTGVKYCRVKVLFSEEDRSPLKIEYTFLQTVWNQRLSSAQPRPGRLQERLRAFERFFQEIERPEGTWMYLSLSETEEKPVPKAPDAWTGGLTLLFDDMYGMWHREEGKS